MPSSIFYILLYLELLTIAKCTLLFSHFTSKAFELCNSMVLEGDNTKYRQNLAEIFTILIFKFIYITSIFTLSMYI